MEHTNDAGIDKINERLPVGRSLIVSHLYLHGKRDAREIAKGRCIAGDTILRTPLYAKGQRPTLTT